MRRHLSSRVSGDAGVAMLLVLGVSAIITVLAVTVSTVSLNNVKSTTRDKQSGSAFATAEAGVAEVVERIRTAKIPLASLTCQEPATPATPLPASCTGATMSWTSAVKPMEVPIDGSAPPCQTSQTCYKVWIGTLRAYDPSVGVQTGLYRVHSKGLFGNGPAASTVVVDLEIKPEQFPIGVYGEKVTGNGGSSFTNLSLFSRACISSRQDGSGNGTRFFGTDLYWDQPASAHSTTSITTSGSCGTNAEVHDSNNCPSKAALYPDQSSKGGPVPSGPCYRQHLRKNGSYYPDAAPTNSCTPRSDGLCDSTSFTNKDLERYGYRPRGLSDDQYEVLATRARTTGTHNVTPSSLATLLTNALNAGVRQPVVYINCVEAPSICGSGSWNLSISDIPTAFQQAPDPAGSFARCATGPQPTVIVVVERGNVVFQGGNNTWFDAAIFVPDGQWLGSGGYSILGTLFSNDLSLGGNQKFALDGCFIRDLPAPLLNLKTVKFAQDDSRDLN